MQHRGFAGKLVTETINAKLKIVFQVQVVSLWMIVIQFNQYNVTRAAISNDGPVLVIWTISPMLPIVVSQSLICMYMLVLSYWFVCLNLLPSEKLLYEVYFHFLIWTYHMRIPFSTIAKKYRFCMNLYQCWIKVWETNNIENIRWQDYCTLRLNS